MTFRPFGSPTSADAAPPPSEERAAEAEGAESVGAEAPGSSDDDVPTGTSSSELEVADEASPSESLSSFLSDLADQEPPTLKKELLNTVEAARLSRVRWAVFILEEVPSIATAAADFPRRALSATWRIILVTIRIFIKSRHS